jgi:hypothetical protein
MTKLITTALRTALMTEPSKSWPTFNGGTLNRHDFLTASEATKCIRSLSFQKTREADMFARTGGTKSDTFWDDMSDEEYQSRLEQMGPDGPYGIFARGNNIEDWIVGMLKSVELPNEKNMFTGKDQRSFYVASHRLSGTPDGLYIDANTHEMKLLEFKSSNAPTVTPRPAHVTQVLVNMGIIKMLLRHDKLPADVPEYDWMRDCIDNFNTGLLVYVRADNYMDVAEFEIEWDGGEAYNRAMHKAKALFKVEDGVQSITPPAECEPTGLSNRYMCRFCDDKLGCLAIETAKNDAANIKIIQQALAGDDYEVPRVPFFGKDEKEKVISALIEFDNWNKVSKDAEATMKSMADAIKDWVRKQPDMKAKFVAGDDKVSVSLSQTTRSGSLDKERLAAALKEVGKALEEFEGASISYETLRVTVKPSK